MTLQNYLHASRSLAKLSSLGDIRESNANEGVVNKLLNVVCDHDASSDQIYSAVLVAIAPTTPMVPVQGGVLPKSSQMAGQKVTNFEIGQYPVTLEEWQGVRKWAVENGFDISEGTGGGPLHPVVEINWYDAIKWCNAKSILDGLEPMYGLSGREGYFSIGDFGGNGSNNVVWLGNTQGFRLPMECEWEWAARGGHKSKGYTFSGGNNLDAVGWYRQNASSSTHAVGQKAPNELDLYDMSGNIEEWVFDAVPHYGSRKVRGGEYSQPEEYHAVSWREGNIDPSYAYNTVGFRLARSL